MYTGFIKAFVFIFIAGITNNENADSLLAGYNTMSDEKKKNVDFKSIVRKLKQTMYTAAVLLIMVGLLNFVIDNQKIIVLAYLNITVIACVYLLMGTQKFDTNHYSFWEKLLPQCIVVFLILALIFGNYYIWITPLEELKW